VREFVLTLLEFEQVHIVTRAENYAALHAKSDYKRAGIKLIPWKRVPIEAVRTYGNACCADELLTLRSLHRERH